MSWFTSRTLGRWTAVALLSVVTASAWGAPTKEQQAELSTAGKLMIKAGTLYKEGKFKEAGEAVKEAQGKIETLADTSDKQLISQLNTLQKRLQNAHAILELEGVSLPELKPIESMVKPEKPATPKDAPMAGTVSFTKQVAPLINAKCGGCHVRGMRGELSMATYESMMAGTKGNLKIVFPGDSAGSTIIEQLESASMPPNGGKLPDAEIAMLKQWINEGAKYDGADTKSNLGDLANATGVPKVEVPAVMVTAATGKESISFSRDVAPVLAETCGNCHGDLRPRENFNLSTFEGLLKGGDSGAPVTPGKAADSLLVKKIKGTATEGARMPLNSPPLSDEVIAKIEKWVEEGAKFDAPNPKQKLSVLAAVYKAEHSTHEELTADRKQLAAANWALAMPDRTADHVETANFQILGDLGTAALSQVGVEAEALAPKVATLFKAPSDQALIKGKMTLFVFGRRYDYSEFGKMVEKRDLPPEWRGHFRFDIVDAYGAIVSPRVEDTYSRESMLIQQIGAAYIGSLGKGTAPGWFAEGCGRVAASRMVAGDPRIKAWNDNLPAVLGSMSSPDDFLTGKLPLEARDIASYSFAAFLMKDSPRFHKLLDSMRSGAEFNEAFVATYGGTPSQATQAWIRKPSVPKPIGKKLGSK